MLIFSTFQMYLYGSVGYQAIFKPRYKQKELMCKGGTDFTVILDQSSGKMLAKIF